MAISGAAKQSALQEELACEPQPQRVHYFLEKYTLCQFVIVARARASGLEGVDWPVLSHLTGPLCARRLTARQLPGRGHHDWPVKWALSTSFRKEVSGVH